MKAGRKRYLNNVPIMEAQQKFLGNNYGLCGEEVIPVPQALGRVTARAVFARISSPHYHAAAMDGLAVRALDTVGASERTPKRLRLGEQAFPIDTGMSLPDGCDAVIMAEDITETGDEAEITAAVPPWQHVRPIGEDIVATEMILPAGHRLRGVDAGALLSGGITEVAVCKKPRVAIIPTGNELVPPGTDPRPGQIIESNSVIFAAMVEEWGGQALRCEPVPDDFERISAAVHKAATDNDIVLINAGSSAGRKDYTADVVTKWGEILVHGVAVKPGKPVILGNVLGKPVIGVPGYPVSAVVALDLFLKPLLYRMQGQTEPVRPRLQAVFSRQVTSSLAAEEWIRVKVGKVGDRYVATPLTRGSGVLTSLVRADGIVRVPQQKEGLTAGENVLVELLRSPEHIDNTVVAIGSHDLTLDILGDMLSRKYPGCSLSSSHAGSTGGIMALRRNEAHLAGTHLLHEESGQYNVPFIEEFLPGESIILITLAERDQGLMVAAGNPKNIYDVEDLTRPGVSFINRQRGAGTRLLLDSRLREKGISQADITGYQREEYTHLAVAAAVAAGSADAGLGIMAAAVSQGLDFVPLVRERYDLAIPEKYLASGPVQNLLSVVRSAEFIEAVKALGGYHTGLTGKIVPREGDK